MNPAILGALIGAIPGTLAAALTTWSAVHTSNNNLEQTGMALAADHDRWLREKRANVYVDLLHFLRECERRRRVTLKPRKATEEIRHAIKEGFEIYRIPETQQLVARGYAYTSSKAYDAFGDAWHADQIVWALAWKSIAGDDLRIGNELAETIEKADKASEVFCDIARSDLQEPLSTRPAKKNNVP